MRKPYTTVCTPNAARKRLVASLEKYREYLKSRQQDLTQRKQVEKVLQKVKENQKEGPGGRSCWEANEKPKRICNHMYRMLRNMEVLQTRLKQTAPGDENGHVKSDQKVIPRMKYKMEKPYETVCTPNAARKRLVASLEKYREYLKSRQQDLTQRKQVEKVLQKVKENQKEGPGGRSCWEANEKPKRICNHMYRMLRNMEVLLTRLRQTASGDENGETKRETNKLSLDEKRISELAKPKKAKLKATLDSYRMTPDRRERIKYELGPMDVEQKPKKKLLRKSRQEQIRNATDLFEQIERKVTEDLTDEIVCKLSKKLPKLIVNREEPLMVTSNVQKLKYAACHFLLNSSGPPKDEDEIECYRNFSGLIGDFVVSTMLKSMNPIKVYFLESPEPLKAVEKNHHLLKIAQNQLLKIAQLSKKIQPDINMDQLVKDQEVINSKENVVSSFENPQEFTAQ